MLHDKYLLRNYFYFLDDMYSIKYMLKISSMSAGNFLLIHQIILKDGWRIPYFWLCSNLLIISVLFKFVPSYNIKMLSMATWADTPVQTKSESRSQNVFLRWYLCFTWPHSVLVVNNLLVYLCPCNPTLYCFCWLLSRQNLEFQIDDLFL